MTDLILKNTYLFEFYNECYNEYIKLDVNPTIEFYTFMLDLFKSDVYDMLFVEIVNWKIYKYPILKWVMDQKPIIAMGYGKCYSNCHLVIDILDELVIGLRKKKIDKLLYN